MRWIKEPPSKDGWYWVRNGNGPPFIVEVLWNFVQKHFFAWEVRDLDCHELDDFIAFYGPIEVPYPNPHD